MRRPSPWSVAFGAAALGTALLLLALGRHATLWADAWVFVAARQAWDAAAFLSPHWEHPVLGVALVWKPLFATVGLSSFLPYLLPVAVAHVITAAAVYRMVRRSAGDAFGFAAALSLLLLGSAGEVLLHALPLNLVGSAAAGAWALALFLEAPGRRGQAAIAVLLLVSIAFSGAALFFVAAIGAALLLLPGRRRELLLLVPTVVAYLAWQVAWGTDRIGGEGSLLDQGRLIPEYVRAGVAHAVGAVTGMDDEVGLVLAVLLVAATLWHTLGSRPLLLGAIAGLAGLVAQYAITGVARAHLVEADGRSQAEASRYVYTAAVFLLVAGGAWLGRRPPLALTSARQVVPVVAAVGFAVAANVTQLLWWDRYVDERAHEVRAAIGILEQHRGSPALPGDQRLRLPADSALYGLPSPDRLAAILADIGSPLDPDPFVPGRPAVPPAIQERVLLDLVDGSFVVGPGDGLPAAAAPPEVRVTTDVAVTQDGACLLVAPSGPAPAVVVAASGGTHLLLGADPGGTAVATLSRDGTFGDRAVRSVPLSAASSTAVTLPDLDAAWPWLVHVALPAAGTTRLCAAPGTAP